MRWKRTGTGLAVLGCCVALVLSVFAGDVSRGRAQDVGPPAGEEGRPVTVRAGGCGEELGEVVALLSDLTPFDGDAVGQRSAVAAESSYTNVPLTPEEIQAEDHVIEATVEVDDETSIVCGEIGGPLSPNGTLIVGLREQGGSSFTGIAYLSPGADGSSTDISVFVADGLTQGRNRVVTGRDEGSAAATPVARVEPAETVETSLVEWSVDLPAEMEAGRTAFEVSNDGTVRHRFAIEGEGIDAVLEANLQPGETDTLEVDLEPGTYVVSCPIANHRGRGMETEIVVE